MGGLCPDSGAGVEPCRNNGLVPCVAAPHFHLGKDERLLYFISKCPCKRPFSGKCVCLVVYHLLESGSPRDKRSPAQRYIFFTFSSFLWWSQRSFVCQLHSRDLPDVAGSLWQPPTFLVLSGICVFTCCSNTGWGVGFCWERLSGVQQRWC